jgi:hypothetical protein
MRNILRGPFFFKMSKCGNFLKVPESLKVIKKTITLANETVFLRRSSILSVNN